jgi:uncharacterized protein YggT (Ycf19 family)
LKIGVTGTFAHFQTAGTSPVLSVFQKFVARLALPDLSAARESWHQRHLVQVLTKVLIFIIFVFTLVVSIFSRTVPLLAAVSGMSFTPSSVNTVLKYLFNSLAMSSLSVTDLPLLSFRGPTALCS